MLHMRTLQCTYTSGKPNPPITAKNVESAVVPLSSEEAVSKIRIACDKLMIWHLLSLKVGILANSAYYARA